MAERKQRTAPKKRVTKPKPKPETVEPLDEELKLWLLLQCLEEEPVEALKAALAEYRDSGASEGKLALAVDFANDCLDRSEGNRRVFAQWVCECLTSSRVQMDKAEDVARLKLLKDHLTPEQLIRLDEFNHQCLRALG